MTERHTARREGSMSTLNENAATNVAIAPKLEVRCELDRGKASETTADVPRRARKLRVAAVVAGLLVFLGVGWGAGVKTSELGFGQVSLWFQDTADALRSHLETQGKNIIVLVRALASPSAPSEATSPDRAADETTAAERAERSSEALGIKVDLLRLSSATVVSELGKGFEHLNGSVERGQRELLAKLDQLQGRLERLEHQISTASSRGQAQPSEQPSAARNGTPASQASAAPAPAETAKPMTPPAQVKRIENWAVRDVVDGMAILAGPGGIVGVFNGDVVPGVGRVESISRRGGRWVVATRKGVITGR
jgi:hypothetical protein